MEKIMKNIDTAIANGLKKGRDNDIEQQAREIAKKTLNECVESKLCLNEYIEFAAYRAALEALRTREGYILVPVEVVELLKIAQKCFEDLEEEYESEPEESSRFKSMINAIGEDDE